jgi:hypothetical protein
MKAGWIRGLLVAGLLGAAWSPGQASSADLANAIPLGDDSQIKGFRVPNYDDQSVMTSQIFGDFARVLPDGNVEITELRMEFYSYADGERITDMTVTSPMCLFHRARGLVISDSDVRISRDDLTVTGKGFMWSNQRQELRILNESRVELKKARKDKKAGE